MKPMNAREAESYLRRFGFARKSSRGGHLKLFNPTSGRSAIIPVHAGRTLPQGTLLSIFRQAGVEPPKR